MGKRKGLGIKRTAKRDVRRITNTYNTVSSNINSTSKPFSDTAKYLWNIGSNSSSQLIKSMSPYKGKSQPPDHISSLPPKRTGTIVTAAAAQPTSFVKLHKTIRGPGYIPVGSPFQNIARTLKHDFAFDLSAAIGKRDYTGISVRHSRSGYTDANNFVLSPAFGSSARNFEGVSCSSVVRDGSATDLLVSTSLFDLELASWNANALKFLSDTGIATATGAVAIGSLSVYNDCLPSADHNKFTPFPNTIHTLGTDTDVKRPPFLVHLGSGSITFNCQNRLPTDCEVEWVVYQHRDEQMIDKTDHLQSQIITYSNTCYTNKLKGPRLTTESTGSGGVDYVNDDCLFNPDYKLLGYWPRYASARPPCVERHRVKALISGGAAKQFKFILPERIYDSQRNRSSSSDPFADSPTDASGISLEGYLFVVAVNGVVMPVFTAPSGNSTAAVDQCNLAVIDRLACTSSILVTGSYVEHPKPCLPTQQSKVYNNFPIMQTTVPPGTHTLVSGYVNAMHTASGNVTSFQQLGQSTAGLESMDST